VTAPGGGGGGVLPPSFGFTAAPGRVLTFSSVVGATDCCSRSPAAMIADGTTSLIASGTTNIGAGNGISGIVAPRQMFLAGAFLDDSVPGGAAPASLDFSSLGTSFASLSPQLRQMFFIGDGLTGIGIGSAQQFNVPTGATRLFLGFADTSLFVNLNPGFYNDNLGTLRATLEISSGTAVVPVPASLPLLLTGLGLFGFLTRRRG
jgi:hypothetical protein